MRKFFRNKKKHQASKTASVKSVINLIKNTASHVNFSLGKFIDKLVHVPHAGTPLFLPVMCTNASAAVTPASLPRKSSMEA